MRQLGPHIYAYACASAVNGIHFNHVGIDLSTIYFMFIYDIERLTKLPPALMEGMVLRQPGHLKLAKIQQLALERLNQPVYIKDMIVTVHHFYRSSQLSEIYCLGESTSYDRNTYDERSYTERLRGHITTLFNLANEEHRANYCQKEDDGTYTLKKGMENHITRLSMSEFSLYTSNPLTMGEFQSLVSDLEPMAEQLESNVHVLLSTFAVRDSHNQLINIFLFVEGGQPPVFHAIAKNRTSISDVNYRMSIGLFSQHYQGHKFNEHAAQIAGDNGDGTSAISTGSVFELSTKGGACFTQAIDICIDHGYGHSRALMTKRITDALHSDEILPDQIEHCITSFGTEIISENTIANRVLHVDPGYTHDVPLCDKRLSGETLSSIVPAGFNHTKISINKEGYLIADPIFGPTDCVIQVYAERPASRYKPELQESILAHNQRALKNKHMTIAQPTDNLVQKILSKRIAEMEQTMLKHCQLTALEKFFNAQEHQQKEKAVKIINNSITFLKQIIEEHGTDSIHFIRGWKNHFNFGLSLLDPCPRQSPLVRSLSAALTDFVTTNLQGDLGIEFADKDAVDEETKTLGPKAI